jgi:tetratricopeptide (TPR) repeat protein
VIGCGTSFAYKGKSVPARELARVLGVRHVVEGSVRRAGARVRITARLTDAGNGQELWSERYDRELGDVFALQDEVVGGIVAELRRALDASLEHVPRARSVRPEVWALLVQGRAQLELNSPPAVEAGRELLERCVALAPDFAPGWAELSRSEATIFFFGMEHERTLDRAAEHARRALELDADDPDAHHALSFVQGLSGASDAAIASARRGLALAPGRADLRLRLATTLNLLGRTEEAIPILKGLSRLDPELRYMHIFQLALCYRRLGRIDEAIAKHHESLRERPDFIGPYLNLAAIHAQLGELNQARAAFEQVLRIRPDFSSASIPRFPTGRGFMLDNLRKVGLRD